MFSLVDIGEDQLVMFVNFYGWTGAARDPHAAARTDILIDIAIQELAMHHKVPTLFVGDFNGNTFNFPTLTKMLDKLGWTDIGANASRGAKMTLNLPALLPEPKHPPGEIMSLLTHLA